MILEYFFIYIHKRNGFLVVSLSYFASYWKGSSIELACGVVCREFHWLLIDTGGPRTWWGAQCHPWARGVPGMYKNRKWAWTWEQASKHHSSVVSASIPASRLLSWLHQWWTVTWKLRDEITHFLCKLLSGQGCKLSVEMPMRGIMIFMRDFNISVYSYIHDPLLSTSNIYKTRVVVLMLLSQLARSQIWVLKNLL